MTEHVVGLESKLPALLQVRPRSCVFECVCFRGLRFVVCVVMCVVCQPFKQAQGTMHNALEQLSAYLELHFEQVCAHGSCVVGKALID
mgnify:CR=1 FL=1